MAGLIPNDFIDDLIDRSDIIEVIGKQIDLKKKGKDHWACCPFHNENSPSFSVNQSKGFYYCFGCGAKGNSLKFLQEYNNLGFVEAIEELARINGVEVPREQSSPAAAARQKQRKTLHDTMQSCADYYVHQMFHHPQAKNVQDYVLKRGLSEQTIQTFQIGYAPAGWDNLLSHFQSGDDRNSLMTGGMLSQNDQGRVYDRFRNRLMFPIRDIKGRVIAFGGRVIAADDKPKYLNSPETPIFHKGQELYGLYEARKALKTLENVIIVEGYMDVVALAQQGIRNAVATLGTATSSQHIQRLFKLTSEIIFCFDGDDAGRRAAERALTNLLPELRDGLQARFLFLPQGEDPDSLVQAEGQERFRHRLQQAKTTADFLFEHLQAQVDLNSLDGKAKFAKLMKPWIDTVPDGIFRDLLFGRLSDTVGLPTETLHARFDNNANDVSPASTFEPQEAVDWNNQSPLPDYPSENQLTVRVGTVHRALAWLIRFPNLAPTVSDEALNKINRSNDEGLLVTVVELLKQAPKKDLYQAFDYLCQHGLRQQLSPLAHSDYLWLEATNDQHQKEEDFAASELEKLIRTLSVRSPDNEYESLKQRVLALDPLLTEHDKRRYTELLRKRKM